MKSNFAAALPLVLQHEGGYVNHAKDPGGPTNLGVTLATARRLKIDVDGDGDTDIIDIKKLTPEHAGIVYRANYWNAVRGDELPAGVDYCVFDFGVNSGPNRSIRYLQRAVGVDDDGTIGPITLDAVWSANPTKVINDLCDARLRFLRGLSTWGTFGKGWSRRVAGVRSEALKMTEFIPPIPDDPGVEPKPPPLDLMSILRLIANRLRAVFSWRRR